VWLSHVPSVSSPDLPFEVHPWALYPVNVLDISRNYGLDLKKTINDKKYLASFVGAHMPHYLSDMRLRLEQFENEDDFSIKVNDEWHFNQTVYQEQVKGLILETGNCFDHSVFNYNSILTNSRFALCPSGAGRNTIRFWEALAVGSVPVTLGEAFALPSGGSLPHIPWNKMVINIEDSQLKKLPDLLRSYSTTEILEMSQLGQMASILVRNQTCF
jgi:hypothetical protein